MGYGYGEDCGAAREAQSQAQDAQREVNYLRDELSNEISRVRSDVSDETASRRAVADELWDAIYELREQLKGVSK